MQKSERAMALFKKLPLGLTCDFPSFEGRQIQDRLR